MVKNPPANAGDTGNAGSISGSGGSPEEGNGNPLQYSHLENPMDRGAWRVTIYEGCKNLDTTEQLTTHASESQLQRKNVVCKVNNAA